MRMYYFLFLIFCFSGCATSWKSTLMSEGGKEEAMLNAITDFSNNSTRKKKKKKFSVEIYIDESEVWGISISEAIEKKPHVGPEIKSGGYPETLPVRFLAKAGILYYLYDFTNDISEESINVPSAYNLIDSTTINGFNGEIPGDVLTELPKAVHYYFCKNNLRNYKKVTTNKVMGGYKRPKLNCNHK